MAIKKYSRQNKRKLTQKLGQRGGSKMPKPTKLTKPTKPLPYITNNHRRSFVNPLYGTTTPTSTHTKPTKSTYNAPLDPLVSLGSLVKNNPTYVTNVTKFIPVADTKQKTFNNSIQQKIYNPTTPSNTSFHLRQLRRVLSGHELLPNNKQQTTNNKQNARRI